MKILLFLGLGNILEWYDFGLYIYLAPCLGEYFFPANDPHSSTLITFSVFAVGFICRPLGGILFGHFGDTHGRASTLWRSILMIASSTLLIGLLPTYQSIGLFAPILFITLRLIQGLSVGGEYSGVMVYLAETAPEHHRALYTSFAAVGANLGFLLAILLSRTLDVASVHNHSNLWRVPFMVGGLLGFIILAGRLHLQETPSFIKLKKAALICQQPLLTSLRQSPKVLGKITLLTSMGATLYYVFFGFMPMILVQQQALSSQDSQLLQISCLVAMLVLVPIAAAFSDKFGRKPMLFILGFGLLLFALPAFYGLFSQNNYYLVLTMVGATLLSSIEQGNTLITAVENCPIAVRYSGLAFSYNLGNALFGGLSPIIITLLIAKTGLWGPAFFMMLIALLGIVVTALLPETYRSVSATT